MPQVAVLRDLCASRGEAQVCEYADLWHHINLTLLGAMLSPVAKESLFAKPC